MRLFTFILLFIAAFNIVLAQGKANSENDPFAAIPKSELFMLGTFHFKDAGLDGYKPQFDIDILSEKRQKELDDVLDAIRKFAPTKIAVEWKKARQPKLDSLYREYLVGNFQLKSNEIYQIGFRMAKEMGHDKIYAMDAQPRNFDDGYTRETYKEKEAYFEEKMGAEFMAREAAIHDTYMAMYGEEDKRKTRHTLLDQLLFLNDEQRMQLGHGHYLIGNFKMNEQEDYFGADGAIWWYTRNIRIFANLLSITNPGKEKLFVLIGAGHTPIINFLAKASPDYKLVTLRDMTSAK